MPRINKDDARRIRATVHHFERTARNKLPPVPKKVRLQSEAEAGADGDSSGGPCECAQIAVGTQTCESSNDSPSVYELTGLTIDGVAVFGATIELAIDDTCVWLSDDLDYDCA